MSATVIYIHGFLSSPQSHKAQLAADYFKRHHPDIRFLVPDMPNHPAGAFARLDQLVKDELARLAPAKPHLREFLRDVKSRKALFDDEGADRGPRLRGVHLRVDDDHIGDGPVRDEYARGGPAGRRRRG